MNAIQRFDQAAVGGERLEQDGGLGARERDPHTGNRLLGAGKHLASYGSHGYTKDKDRITMKY